jgi:preprotein translocase subunit SecE
LARAPVSKTGGWGFETLHPCQPCPSVNRARLLTMPVRGWHPGPAIAAEPNCPNEGRQRSMSGVALDPTKFVREVRSEMAKVTWPSRKETLVTTGLVLAMAALATVFFFVADQVIGVGVRALFGAGG